MGGEFEGSGGICWRARMGEIGAIVGGSGTSISRYQGTDSDCVSGGTLSDGCESPFASVSNFSACIDWNRRVVVCIRRGRVGL